MTKLATETLQGFNQFLSDQKKLEGEAALTVATFSSTYTLAHDFTPLKNVKDFTVEDYKTGGYTALLDAIGNTINATGAKLAAMAEEDRPSKVIFVIITDGAENYSRLFTRSQIFDMITHQREKYSWEFVFLGADQNAIQEGMSLGVTAHNSMAYVADSVGIYSNYATISSNISSYRSGDLQQVNFFDQQKTVTTPLDQSATQNQYEKHPVTIK
jgi:uncharacterized protein YegL